MCVVLLNIKEKHPLDTYHFIIRRLKGGSKILQKGLNLQNKGVVSCLFLKHTKFRQI